MILHYLGLDHIGHLDGPRSLLVPSKLGEMDEIVQHVVNTLYKQVAAAGMLYIYIWKVWYSGLNVCYTLFDKHLYE